MTWNILKIKCRYKKIDIKMIEIDHEIIFIKRIWLQFFGQFDEIRYLASKINDCD